MSEPNDVTHIDDDGVSYSYLGENNYAVFMDKERNPHWREMPDNTIEFASSIRSVADIQLIAELEEAILNMQIGISSINDLAGVISAFIENIEPRTSEAVKAYNKCMEIVSDIADMDIPEFEALKEQDNADNG